MNLLQTRLLRLEELSKRRPQYIEIYDFYSGLCKFLQSKNGDWLTCNPNLESWDARREAGFPLLDSDALQIDSAAADQFVAQLIDALIELGQEGGEELQVMQQALAEKQISSSTLLLACLKKDRAPFEQTATQLGVPSALLEYVCSTTLAFGLQNWLAHTDPASLENWTEGYCPVCGAVPTMGEIVGEDGQKKLHCSICASNWQASRMKCSYCGNEERQGLEYFTAEGETGYRVDICRKCSCYLKVVDSRELGEGLPMDIEDLNTMHLDLLAQQEGFAKGKTERKT